MMLTNQTGEVGSPVYTDRESFRAFISGKDIAWIIYYQNLPASTMIYILHHPVESILAALVGLVTLDRPLDLPGASQGVSAVIKSIELA